jgi:ATP-binding cassette subfamily F protein 3
LLTQEPDLLMLDEPTNHLDLESLLWFQNYLQGYPGAILVISHDREFLNNLVSGIVEIRQSQLFRYTGNYDDYLGQREANELQQLAAYKNQQKEIAHLMEFANRFRAKASKASQAQSKLKQIERMDKIAAPEADDKKVSFAFPQPERSGQRVIWLQGLDFAYGKTVVYQNAELEVERGERIVLVGPNGAGKSTLLKLLAARLQPQKGVRGLGHNVRAGYYSQYRVDMLQEERTVLAEASDTPARLPELFVRTLLGSFLFSGDDVFKKVGMLSGGEKSRLALVKLLLDPPNLLLMDEPTTHLDMSSIDALLGALLQFEGTLVFISHDVYFIKQLANKVIHVSNGKLTHYAGDYEHYLYKTGSLSARAALTAGSGEAAPKTPAGKASAKPGDDKKAQRRAEREQQEAAAAALKKEKQAVARLEQQIEKLEQRLAAINAELVQPAAFQPGGRGHELSRELRQLQPQLAALTAQWEAAASKLQALEPR